MMKERIQLDLQRERKEKVFPKNLNHLKHHFFQNAYKNGANFDKDKP